jgi:hypothetical protein
MKRVGAESSARFWVVAPGNANRLARKLSRDNVQWCYFGTDTSKRRTAARAFASCPRVGFAEELNRIAYKLKQPFLDWVAEIGARQDDQLNWWASRLASKSTLQTDFFLLVCYHMLFGSWVTGSNKLSMRVIVVEDPWLRYLLQRDFGGVPQVRVMGHAVVDVIADASYWLARIPLSVLYIIMIYLWRKFSAGVILPQSRTRGMGVASERLDVLLYTWIEQSCFTSPGKLSDAYTGRLEDILAKNGQTVKRMTPLAIKTKFLWQLRPVAQDLVVTPHYLRFWDIFRDAASFFTIKYLKASEPIGGCDYRPLLEREMLREWGHPGFAGYRLTYRAMRQLARECVGGVKCVIYPFENQPWEKMLCLALRDEIPQMRLVGYQHASIPTLVLCFFLGKNESEYAPLPDFIVTNGKANLNLLKNGGFPSEKLLDGGAFRFEYLHGLQKRVVLRDRPITGEYRVLVAFPTSKPHAASLLEDLLELFPQPFRDNNRGHRVVFVLKCHPDLPWEMLAGEAPRLPAWFTVSKQPLSVLIDTVDLFLYSPPTGTWREAYLAGVPVLKYRGEFLDVDSTETLRIEELPICSRDTLRDQIHTLLAKASVSDKETRRGFLDQIFSPVDESVWLKLVANEPDHHK